NLKLAGVVNATQIAVEEVGRDVPNTCLSGRSCRNHWLGGFEIH
ncbi:unnamed protein product, partial [marine sediment metagenome]